MDKRLLWNNVALGLIVVCVWLVDFHYINRLLYKIDRKTMDAYEDIRAGLRSELASTALSKSCEHVYYNSQDTVYLTFVNFKSLNSTAVDRYIESYQRAYQKIFSDAHGLRIYIKTLKTTVTSLVGLVGNVRNEFAGIHTQKQNIYEIYIFNEFFDNQMIKDGNRAFIKTSKSKLADPAFIADVAKQTVYYFKNLGRYREIGQVLQLPLPQAYRNATLTCLKQQLVYYIDSLEYVNGNRNLVFFDNYLKEIEEEADQLKAYLKADDLRALERVLLKNEYFIYTSAYMYEDY